MAPAPTALSARGVPILDTRRPSGAVRSDRRDPRLSTSERQPEPRERHLDLLTALRSHPLERADTLARLTDELTERRDGGSRQGVVCAHAGAEHRHVELEKRTRSSSFGGPIATLGSSADRVGKRSRTTCSRAQDDDGAGAEQVDAYAGDGQMIGDSLLRPTCLMKHEHRTMKRRQARDERGGPRRQSRLEPERDPIDGLIGGAASSDAPPLHPKLYLDFHVGVSACSCSASPACRCPCYCKSRSHRCCRRDRSSRPPACMWTRRR